MERTGIPGTRVVTNPNSGLSKKGWPRRKRRMGPLRRFWIH